jgi:protein-S-isoprenylcysteine O-methyltransferase Ste14
MLNLKSPKGLRPEGAGPRFLLPLAPLVGAAIAATRLWPSVTRFPMRPNEPLVVLGYVWLALGVMFWALSMRRFLMGFRRGELVTHGTYGWCRHPIYSSLLVFWLPALGLIVETWTFYVVAVAAWLVTGAAVGREEAELARLFGQEWAQYADRTRRFLPLPPRGRVRRALASVFWAVFALFLLYTGLLRPIHLGWGTIAVERTMPLPGDDLVPGARYRSTHAISIQAPPDRVWPWLAQMGWGRGGLYSYEGLENLFGCHMKNADSIVAAWQDVQPGDTFRMDQRIPPLTLAIVDPPHALVISDPRDPSGPSTAAPHLAWQFIVEPGPNETSRLLVRWQSTFPRGVVSEFFSKTMLEPISFIMEERMLRGIKERAERSVK